MNLKNEIDYQPRVKKIDKLMDARPNTPEVLDVLVTLVRAWKFPPKP